jgi:hypothetical protein
MKSDSNNYITLYLYVIPTSRLSASTWEVSTWPVPTSNVKKLIKKSNIHAIGTMLMTILLNIKT